MRNSKQGCYQFSYISTWTVINVYLFTKQYNLNTIIPFHKFIDINEDNELIGLNLSKQQNKLLKDQKVIIYQNTIMEKHSKNII